MRLRSRPRSRMGPAAVTAGVVLAAGAVVDSGGTFSVALDQGSGAVVLPDGRYHVRAASGGRSEAVSFVVGPPLTP